MALRQQTPRFWYSNAETILTKALSPLSLLYNAARKVHSFLRENNAYIPPIPVICIGNLTAGGSGKTPSALALMNLIKEHKIFLNPCFVTKGYGQDEEYLLRKLAPVYIEKNRAKAIQQAHENKHDLVILDDGFQDGSIIKNLHVLIIDGTYGFGNRKLLPAGPLREPLNCGLKRADCAIIIGEDTYGAKALLSKDTPVFNASIEPTYQPDKTRTYLAFAGIALPEKFYSTLRDTLGLNIAETQSFPDHHPYTQENINALVAKAKALNAIPITTEKDAVKLTNFENTESIEVLSVTLNIRKPVDLLMHLTHKLQDDKTHPLYS